MLWLLLQKENTILCSFHENKKVLAKLAEKAFLVGWLYEGRIRIFPLEPLKMNIQHTDTFPIFQA